MQLSTSYEVGMTGTCSERPRVTTTMDTKRTIRTILRLIKLTILAVTTGGSIGISFGDLGASIEESVAESMTITNTSLSEYPCGEDIDGVFTCALLVEPTCVRMKGTCEAGDLGTVPVRCIAFSKDAEICACLRETAC